jgi:hypothetical protein
MRIILFIREFFCAWLIFSYLYEASSGEKKYRHSTIQVFYIANLEKYLLKT